MDNFKNTKTFRNDYISTIVYEIANKENPKQKYFAELVKTETFFDDDDNIMLDLDRCHFMAKFIINSFKAAIHGAVANYVGMSPTFFDDKSNLSFLINYYPNGSLENFFEIDTLSISPTNIQFIFYGIASGMTFLKSNLKLIPNLIKSNILLDEFLFPKISFYETLLSNHDYQCNNDLNKSRGRYIMKSFLMGQKVNRKKFFFFL